MKTSRQAADSACLDEFLQVVDREERVQNVRVGGLLVPGEIRRKEARRRRLGRPGPDLLRHEQSSRRRVLLPKRAGRRDQREPAL